MLNELVTQGDSMGFCLLSWCKITRFARVYGVEITIVKLGLHVQWSSYMVDIPRYGSSIHLQACFFLHHKDSTSGMDANNTIHDDFTVAHLIILGRNVLLTHPTGYKHHGRRSGEVWFGTSWELMVWGVRWMDEWTRHPRCQAVGRTKAWVQVGLHTRRKSWKGLERTQDDRPRQHPICKKKWPSETLRNVKAQTVPLFVHADGVEISTPRGTLLSVELGAVFWNQFHCLASGQGRLQEQWLKELRCRGRFLCCLQLRAWRQPERKSTMQQEAFDGAQWSFAIEFVTH